MELQPQTDTGTPATSTLHMTPEAPDGSLMLLRCRMTAEEEEELMACRLHCARQFLNLVYVFTDVPESFMTLPIEVAG